MANYDYLPALPPVDPRNGPEAIETILWWIQRFRLAFPNAVGAAIDPSNTGQSASGDSSRGGSLTITETPTGVSYTPDTLGNDASGALIGHVDVAFTLPARAAGVAVEYREDGVTNYERLYFTSSPARVLGLKVGLTYNFRIAGVAANEDLGPFTNASNVVVSANLASAPSAPTNPAATGYPQAIIVSWDAHGDSTVKQYAIQRADDAAFTTNSVVYYARTNFFVDEFAGQGVVRYYRVRARRDSGQESTNSSSVSATTEGTDTAELVDNAVTTTGVVTTAGPVSAGSGSETDIEDVTISTNGGIVLVFATATITLNDNESALINIYKGDSATGTIIGAASLPAATGASVGVTITAVAVDASPGSTQEYTSTFTPTSGGNRDANDIAMIATNIKK